MFTLGWSFEPWTGEKSVADGADILAYIRATAEKYGVDRRIIYQRRGVSASWSTDEQCWTVEILHTDTGERSTRTCRFLAACVGYYRYDQGHRPQFPGEDEFAGTIVHPQHWPEDLNVEAKEIVVIGSGATAVTLVPALAKTASHVVMLQRSPTYVAARPDVDVLANKLRKYLPKMLAYRLVRWKNVVLSTLMFQIARRRPDKVKSALRDAAVEMLPEGYEVDVHFNPSYNPWDQRLCLIPNGDLFAAIAAGEVEVVTDTIETFTKSGISLTSGRQLDADIVVTATGLEMEIMSSMQICVDGEEIDPGKSVLYKGMMISSVPNLSFTFGYTNASWTLKADLTADYLCRLLKELDRRQVTSVIPNPPPQGTALESFIDFSSGYVQRSASKLPKQASTKPWKLHQNYFMDLMMFRFGRLNHEVTWNSAPKQPSATSSR
jgi:cation diffusion facilitator CzcD-associated flavoprotein CzcO